MDDHSFGEVLHAPLPVKTGPLRYREPDVMFRDSSAPKVDPRTKYFWDYVSFVAEVLADEPSERDRDLIDKRIEYAEASIAEYWVVDPQPRQVTVLRLQGGDYADFGTFGIQDLVRSSVVPGFEIPVAEIFAK
ncbi:MAG: Uma2 family endonuclease [Planctomycetaceae bacterium]